MTEIEWTKGSPEEFKKKLDAEKLFGEPVRNFFRKALIYMQGIARGEAPRDRGQLVQSITFDIDSKPIPLWGKVGTNKGYATHMEYGTGALSQKPAVTGSVPLPSGPELETWARRHGFESGYHVADIIRWKGGVSPHPYMRPALRKAKSQIAEFLREAGKHIERLWGKQ